MLKPMSREEFAQAMSSGRKFCRATLYERQDFMLTLAKSVRFPVREITTETNHWHRAIGKKD